MDIQSMIDVLEAAKAGKTIEFKTKNYHKWVASTGYLSWDFHSYEYRVKPEPREFVIILNEWGNPIGVGKNLLGSIALLTGDGPINPAKVSYLPVREIL